MTHVPIEVALWGGFIFGAIMFVAGWLFAGKKQRLDAECAPGL